MTGVRISFALISHSARFHVFIYNFIDKIDINRAFKMIFIASRANCLQFFFSFLPSLPLPLPLPLPPPWSTGVQFLATPFPVFSCSPDCLRVWLVCFIAIGVEVRAIIGFDKRSARPRH